MFSSKTSSLNIPVSDISETQEMMGKLSDNTTKILAKVLTSRVTEVKNSFRQPLTTRESKKGPEFSEIPQG
jgi:hypothetical protein